MLILTRKIGETVVIGDEVYCTVLGIKGNKVRLGLDAPKATAINRKEIHDRIALENEGALFMGNNEFMMSELIACFKSPEQETSTTH